MPDFFCRAAENVRRKRLPYGIRKLSVRSCITGKPSENDGPAAHRKVVIVWDIRMMSSWMRSSDVFVKSEKVRHAEGLSKLKSRRK